MRDKIRAVYAVIEHFTSVRSAWPEMFRSFQKHQQPLAIPCPAGNYIREVVKDEPVEIDVGYQQAG